MNRPLTLEKPKVVYPDSDGKPMADNTKQFRWIVTIKSGLDALFENDPQVFVAGDLLWYPIEGDPTTRSAPDVMVVFGRPKGDRGSYKQWEEDNIAPQVTFEIWSPGNRPLDLVHKLDFFEKYGVEEFYMYDPDHGDLLGFRRVAGKLQEIPNMCGWMSPRLGIRFDLEGDELILSWPDGERFTPVLEWHRQKIQAQIRAAHEAQRAQKEAQRADQEAQRANVAEAEAARLRALLEAQNKLG